MAQSTPQAANLLSQVGGSALGSIVGEGMGLIFGGINADNQLKTQGALDAQAQQYAEQFQDYSYANQFKLWQETNYPAQVQELEQAGLNPALLYGQRGAGGGMTTGSPAAGNIGPGQAPSTSTAQTAQLAIASQEAQADIALKNAQAAKLQAETSGTPALMSAQTQNLLAGVTNQNAQATLNNANTKLAQLQTQITGATIDDAIAGIRATNADIEQQMQRDVIARNLDQQTMNDKMQIIHAQMLGQLISNTLQKSNIQVNQEQILQMANQITQSINTTAIGRMNANTADAQQQTADALRQLQERMFNYKLDQGPVDDLMNGIRSLIPAFGIHSNVQPTTITPNPNAGQTWQNRSGRY